MPQPELLRRVVQALEAAGVEYMLTGSVVSSLQGEPRASHDIDVVVAMPPSAVEALIAAFPPPDFYLDRDAAQGAIRRRGMFNLIDARDGDKVDFWPLTDGPYDRVRFPRRVVEELSGCRAWVSRPEDTILMKLAWGKRSGGSEKQFTDALRVYEVQRPGLDMQYVRRWIAELDLEDLWRRLEAEAVPVDEAPG